MHRFKAAIDIIGINPFVGVPDRILKALFKQAGTDKGPIPVRGTINDRDYRQTLVRYRGDWRLYINTTMLKNSPKRIGETVELTIGFDPSDRRPAPHPSLTEALDKDPEAKDAFDRLPPSRQKEIVRYIAQLKTEGSRDINIQKALDFLRGKGRFIGRDSGNGLAPCRQPPFGLNR